MIQAGWDCHLHVFDDRPTPTGHYAPETSTLDSIVRVAAEGVGVRRFVLVQPSVYGTDNTLLLDRLRGSNGRHRGVVVIDEHVTSETLRDMHDAGVRGVRFNLVSPVGNSDLGFTELAPRLKEMGWHVQWHAKPGHLPRIAHLHRGAGVTAVLDHIAGFTPRLGAQAAPWAELMQLADQGAWIKLSGLYRLESVAPFDSLAEVIAKAAEMFEGRCVWGSDWPHTFFLDPAVASPAPTYLETWDIIPRVVGVAAAKRMLQDNPPRLYD